MSQFKVTVYVTCRNYGRYLVQCLDSVLNQSLKSWELLIFDEASGDDSLQISEQYAAMWPGQITVIRNENPLGLRACANIAIERAKGEYLVRLDADDYFDESALLVMAGYLDEHPEAGLVYPNWVYIGANGEFLGIENRKRAGIEDAILDLPAHGACTMVRRRVLKDIGGYDERFDSQDGHELWMKVLRRYGVGSVGTPLFFYRQHESSMSRDESRLLEARRRIKECIAVSSGGGPVRPRVIAIVPVKNTYSHLPNVALEPIAGKALLDHTLDTALESGIFHSIIVTSDDLAVLEYCDRKGGVLARLRDARLSDTRAKLAEVVMDAVEYLEGEREIFPDIIVILSLHSPLRRAGHIKEAVDTLRIYQVDQVISTYEDVEVHFKHGPNGMEPLNPGMLNTLRFEREALYVDNGAVHAVWRDFLGQDTLYRGRIGHIVMPREESFQIKSVADYALVRALLEAREDSTKMSPTNTNPT